MIKKLLFAFTAVSLSALPAAAANEKTATPKPAAEKTTETPAKAADTVKKATDTPKKAADTAETAAETPKKASDTAKKATETPKKAAATVKEPAPKKVTEKKPEELSESDKALLAHGEKESAKLSDPQKTQLLDLVNKGDDKALQTIPGVGEAKAANIKEKRPIKTVADIIMVDGIGEVTFDGIVAWVKGGMKADEPAAEPKKPAAKKTEVKKPEVKKPATTEPAKKKTP